MPYRLVVSLVAALVTLAAGTDLNAAQRRAAQVAAVATVPAGDLISVRILSEIGSRTSVEGDTFGIETLEDYYARGKFVLPKGSPGYGVITHIKRAGIFHSGGEMTFQIKRLVTPDGTVFPVETNGSTADADKASEKNGNEAGAYLLLGVGGLLGRRGNDLAIKKGTSFHVATVQTSGIAVVQYGVAPARFDDSLVTPQR